MNATTKKPVKRATAPKKVNLDRLTGEQIEALPEDVLLASLKPHMRRIVKSAFALKGVFKKVP